MNLGENLQNSDKTWFDSAGWIPLSAFDFARNQAKEIKIQMFQN